MKSSPNSLVESQPVQESVTSSSTEKFEIRYKSKDLTFGKNKETETSQGTVRWRKFTAERPRFASVFAKLPQAVNASTVPNEKSFTISRLLTMVSATPSLQLRRRIFQKRQMKTSPNRLVGHQPVRYLFTFINWKNQREYIWFRRWNLWKELKRQRQARELLGKVYRGESTDCRGIFAKPTKNVTSIPHGGIIVGESLHFYVWDCKRWSL